MNNTVKKKITIFGQYKFDIFAKLNFPFKPNKKILDVGCGDGKDGQIFNSAYGLHTYGVDVYKHSNVSKIKNFHFSVASIYKLPFKSNTFDYVFLHDVLHHIDEKGQRYKKHIEGLKELKRVTKKDGYIIIVEGNRYNPLFYPHMVKMEGHNHFKQAYFKKILIDVFPSIKFSFFESHVYPTKWLKFWKMYEYIMEKFVPKAFIAYNVGIFQNK